MLVSLSNGTACLLEADLLSMTLGLVTGAAAEQLLAAPARSASHRIAAACLQLDESGWMAAGAGLGAEAGAGGKAGGGAAGEEEEAEAGLGEGEDGEGGVKKEEQGEGAAGPAGGAGSSSGGSGSSSSSSSKFLWICRRSGRLECYSLPSMRLVFSSSSGLSGREQVLLPGPAAMMAMADLFGAATAEEQPEAAAAAAAPGGSSKGGAGGSSMEDPVVEMRVDAFRVSGQWCWAIAWRRSYTACGWQHLEGFVV